jgi:hypothetical protein
MVPPPLLSLIQPDGFSAVVFGLTLLTADERLLHSHQFSTLAAR